MTIFSRIIAREVPADIVYEDELVLAFRDVNPVAPVHVLVIPKQEIPGLSHMTSAQEGLFGHLMWAASEVARREGLEPDGYRVVTNNGKNGGQSVAHFHLHVLGGRQMGWPPG